MENSRHVAQISGPTGVTKSKPDFLVKAAEELEASRAAAAAAAAPAPAAAPEAPAAPTPKPKPSVPKKRDKVIRKVSAAYAYEAQNDEELSLEEGDVISLLRIEGEWYFGELNGKQGYFPSTYVLEE